MVWNLVGICESRSKKGNFSITNVQTPNLPSIISTGKTYGLPKCGRCWEDPWHQKIPCDETNWNNPSYNGPFPFRTPPTRIIVVLQDYQATAWATRLVIHAMRAKNGGEACGLWKMVLGLVSLRATEKKPKEFGQCWLILPGLLVTICICLRFFWSVLMEHHRKKHVSVFLRLKWKMRLGIRESEWGHTHPPHPPRVVVSKTPRTGI